MTRGPDMGRPTATTKEMRAYRGRHPEYRERERKRAVARGEALNALARRYPAEFTQLYQAELKYAGLWPPRKSGPRRAESDAEGLEEAS